MDILEKIDGILGEDLEKDLKNKIKETMRKEIGISKFTFSKSKEMPSMFIIKFESDKLRKKYASGGPLERFIKSPFEKLPEVKKVQLDFPHDKPKFKLWIRYK